MQKKTVFLAMFYMAHFFLARPTAAHAQSKSDECEICKTALAKDIMSTNSSYQSRLYQLDIIDQKMFEEIGHSANWGLLLPNFSFNGNYSDFSQKRSEYFKLMNFTSDVASSYQQLKIYNSERAYDSYDKCIEQCFQSKARDNIATIVLNKIKDGVGFVIIRVRYVGNDFAYPSAKITLKCKIGNFQTGEKERTIELEKNSFQDFEFIRDNETVDIEAYVNNNLYDRITSKYEKPELPKQFTARAYYSTQYYESVERTDLDFWVSITSWNMDNVSSDNCNCAVCNPYRGKWCHGNYLKRYPEDFPGAHYLANCSSCYFGDIKKIDCGPNQGACRWNWGVFNETKHFEKSANDRNFLISFTVGFGS